jgi:hypothetical protein
MNECRNNERKIACKTRRKVDGKNKKHINIQTEKMKRK